MGFDAIVVLGCSYRDMKSIYNKTMFCQTSICFGSHIYPCYCDLDIALRSRAEIIKSCDSASASLSSILCVALFLVPRLCSWYFAISHHQQPISKREHRKPDKTKRPKRTSVTNVYQRTRFSHSQCFVSYLVLSFDLLLTSRKSAQIRKALGFDFELSRT